MKMTAAQVAPLRAALKKKQGNKCAICKQSFTLTDPAVLDHCHSTGHIRGVLHRTCNGQEGRVRIKAQRCHAGVSADDYLIGLGEYLSDTKTPKYKQIHPTHKTADEKRLALNKKARIKRAQAKAKRIVG
jgi:hypothetical protein